MQPGETRTLKWTPKDAVSFYCTDFCSALHQEIRLRPGVAAWIIVALSEHE
jgi:hypothetical protein